MEIYSIGFTKTTAESFFGRLNRSGVRRLVDVRRNPSSQLSGFAKDRDLPYFLRGAGRCRVRARAATCSDRRAAHRLQARKHAMTWAAYEQQFIALLREREVERRLDPVLRS